MSRHDSTRIWTGGSPVGLDVEVGPPCDGVASSPPRWPRSATPPTATATARTAATEANAVRRRRRRARRRAAPASPSPSGASSPTDRSAVVSRSSKSVTVFLLPLGLGQRLAERGQAAGHPRASAALRNPGQRRDLGVLQLLVV